MPSSMLARIKLFLRRRRTPNTDQDNTPENQPKETFSGGIKPLWSPDDGTIEYVPSSIRKISLMISPSSIVFVHGLTGNPEATWTAQGASEPWPKTLLPSTFPTARVLTFGYDADVVKWRGVVSENYIGNHAFHLLTSLSSYREKDGTVSCPGQLILAAY